MYEFGGFRLHNSKRQLTRNGEALALPPKTFDLLLLLVESGGRALTKAELMHALWADAFVEEANLSFQISTLRKALGEDGAKWIQTIPKHGYSFTEPVERADDEPSSPIDSPSPRSKGSEGPTYGCSRQLAQSRSRCCSSSSPDRPRVASRTRRSHVRVMPGAPFNLNLIEQPLLGTLK